MSSSLKRRVWLWRGEGDAKTENFWANEKSRIPGYMWGRQRSVQHRQPHCQKFSSRFFPFFLLPHWIASTVSSNQVTDSPSASLQCPGFFPLPALPVLATPRCVLLPPRPALPTPATPTRSTYPTPPSSRQSRFSTLASAACARFQTIRSLMLSSSRC